MDSIDTISHHWSEGIKFCSEICTKFAWLNFESASKRHRLLLLVSLVFLIYITVSHDLFLCHYFYCHIEFVILDRILVIRMGVILDEE